MQAELISLNNLLTALIGLFMVYLNFRFTALRERIEDIKKELDAVKKENDEIKLNYLNRFDEVKETIHSVKDDIIKEVLSMNTKLEKHLSFCQSIQELKNKGRRTK